MIAVVAIGFAFLAAILAAGFTLILSNQEDAKRTWRSIMANQADLDTAIAQLKTDVEALIAAQKPIDLQPQVDAVNAIDAEVKAAMPPTP